MTLISMTSSEGLYVPKLSYASTFIFEELSDPCKTSTNKEKCKCDVMIVTIYRV